MGLLLALLFLIINLITNSHYGITWDFPHHFNAGLRHLGLPPDDPQFGTQPYGPISDTLPVLFWLFLSNKWHLLPPDQAYNIISIIYASIGILLIYNITRKISGFLPAILASIILGLSPRFLGESHNNTKDIPSAVAISLVIYLFLIWLNSSKKKWLFTLLSAFAFGFAFNIKINAILVFPIIVFWLLCSYRDQISLSFYNLLKSKIGPFSLWQLSAYFILSIFFSLLIWFPFWEKPIDQLIYIYKHFSQSTTGFWILYFGKIYYANINVPWHYALGYLSAVTPLVIILFFIIGFLKASYDTITLKNRMSGLILFWFLVPVLKYLDPKIGVLDGIRHFLEVLFPLAILSGIGATFCYQTFKRISLKYFSDQKAQKSIKLFLFPLFIFSLSLYLLRQIIPLHPYETAYHSEWIGGIKGAEGNFDIEYWGNALKEGSKWLNNNAPTKAEVASPFAQQVTRFYLRKDLNVSQYPNQKTNYLMFFNRSSFFDMYSENTNLRFFIANKKPLFTITRQNTPILWIYAYP